MNKALIIYPCDSSTDFLQEIINQIAELMEVVVERPDATIEAHEKCIHLIQETSIKLIIFMGHGQSDKLLGANSSNNNKEYQLYREKGFINRDNISIFSGKSVIALSCNSNEKIGKMAIENGAKVFVGFGYIPTDWYVEVEEVSHLEPKEVEEFNAILVNVVSKSLNYCIHHNFTFSQFEKLFKVIVNKEIKEIVASGIPCNSWLLQSMYKLKDEIKVFGDREAHI